MIPARPRVSPFASQYKDTIGTIQPKARARLLQRCPALAEASHCPQCPPPDRPCGAAVELTTCTELLSSQKPPHSRVPSAAQSAPGAGPIIRPRVAGRRQALASRHQQAAGTEKERHQADRGPPKPAGCIVLTEHAPQRELARQTLGAYVILTAARLLLSVSLRSHCSSGDGLTRRRSRCAQRGRWRASQR